MDLDELNYQKRVIRVIINAYVLYPSEINPIDEIAEYIVSEKDKSKRLLHITYGSIIILLLIILNYHTK